MSERAAWQRRRDLSESSRHYHAFQHFRDLPARLRSLDKAYTACLIACPRQKGRVIDLRSASNPEQLPTPLKDAAPNWKRWRKRFLWDARVADYDAWLEVESLEKKRADIRAMNERHAALAVGFLNKAVEWLQQHQDPATPLKLSPALALAFTEKASVIERRARGEATELIRHEDAARMPDLSALSAEDLDRLVALLDKLEQGRAAASPEGA